MSGRAMFYRKLLLLYPKPYQQEYAEQIAQTFEDMLNGENSRSKRGWLVVKEYLTLPGNVIEQHVAEVSRKGGLSARTLIAIVSMILFVPFIIAFGSDEIAERFYGSHSFTDWIWMPSVVFVWLVILPGVSFVISFATYLIYILRKSIQRSRMTFQFRETWPLIAAIFLSTGLLAAVLYRGGYQCFQTSQKGPTQTFQCIVTNLTTHDIK